MFWISAGPAKGFGPSGNKIGKGKGYEAAKRILILVIKLKMNLKKGIECFGTHRAADYACKPQDHFQLINPSKKVY